MLKTFYISKHDLFGSDSHGFHDNGYAIPDLNNYGPIDDLHFHFPRISYLYGSGPPFFKLNFVLFFLNVAA
jgi:hypothetical protein